ncbi:MAG: hypothetical protein WA790_15865 [Sulfitobacter sp.]
MAEPTERIAILLELQNEQFKKSARTAGNEISRLERKFNPLQAAEARLEKQQRRMNAAFEAGTIDMAQHTKGLNLVQREYQNTADRLNGARDNVVAMNSSVAASTGFMNRNRQVFQQAGYQVGDFAVQIQGGQSAITAFTQQGSQMLGVFGAYGAVAGAVLAVGAPLIASFLRGGEEAEEFKDRAKSLTNAVSAYSEAASDAAVPTEVLREKYGTAAEAAKVFALALTDINQAMALEALSAAQGLDAIDSDRIRTLLEILDGVSEDTRAFSSNYKGAINELNDDFGVTEAQARDLLAALDAFGSASGPQEVVASGEALLAVIVATFGPLKNLEGAALALANQVQETSRSAAELQGVTENATLTMLEFASAAYESGGAIASAIGPADQLLGRVQALAGAALEYAGAMGAAERFKNEKGRRGAVDPRTVGGRAIEIQTAEAGEFLSTYKAPKAKRSSSGRGGGSKKELPPLFSIAESELEKMQRAIDMLGKSKGEIAALTVKHKLLDEAKKRGIAVTDELTAKIDAEAAEVGDLAEKYDQARDKIAAMEQIQGQFKDSVIDAAMGGADAMDAFKNSIKRAALEYALFGSGMFAGGKKSGGGLLGGLFGGGGGLLGGLFAGMFDKGGTIPSGKFGIAGENGPEIIRGPAMVTSTKATAAAMQGGGGPMDVRVYVDDDGNWQAKVEQISSDVTRKAAGPIVQQAVKQTGAAMRSTRSFGSPA